jgi:hypothetical protein
MSNFAWRIRTGDLIFIRDSMLNNRMVACGTAVGDPGELAYLFDPSSTIAFGSTVWRHKIPVKWHQDFVEFTYKDRSPNTSVLRLNEWESEQFSRYLSTTDASNLQFDDIDFTPEQGDQLEDVYPRIGHQFSKLIRPRHRALANAFRRWLRSTEHLSSSWERKQIDLRFRRQEWNTLAEFKVAYGGKTRHAIREALGQILEYNHYPKRNRFDQWLLVLDTPPDASDLIFIERLRSVWQLPLFLGWQIGESFRFHPSWPA